MAHMTQSSMHHSLRAQAGRAIQVAEATPRPSRVRFMVKVIGSGESRLEGKHALQFDTLMLDEPSFSFGVVAVGQLADGALPQATAIVLKWVRTKNGGLYTAAEMGFVVDSSQVGITTRFSLTFEASALRTTAGTDKALGLNGVQNSYRGTVIE